jgi:hypothetical protein
MILIAVTRLRCASKKAQTGLIGVSIIGYASRMLPQNEAYLGKDWMLKVDGLLEKDGLVERKNKQSQGRQSDPIHLR